MARKKKVGTFTVECNNKIHEVHIQIEIDSDGVPIVRDGKLSVLALCPEIGIKVEVSSKEEVIKLARQIASKQQETKWERWLKVEIGKGEPDESSDANLADGLSNYGMCEIKFEVIERANIGTPEELWKDISEYERGQNEPHNFSRRGTRYYSDLPRGISKERLISGRERGYCGSYNDTYVFYVKDEGGRKEAVSEMIRQLLSIYDQIIKLAGPTGKTFDSLTEMFAAGSTAPLLPPAPSKKVSKRR